MPSIPGIQAGTQRSVVLPSFRQGCGRAADLRPGESRHEAPPSARTPLSASRKIREHRDAANDRVSDSSGKPRSAYCRAHVRASRSTGPRPRGGRQQRHAVISLFLKRFNATYYGQLQCPCQGLERGDHPGFTTAGSASPAG
jgi:hypothetical protein